MMPDCTLPVRSAAVLGCILVAGCNANDTDREESQTETQRRAALYACPETAFVEQRPLMGPQFDRARGGMLGEPRASYVAFTSQAYPKPEQRQRFSAFVDAIAAQLDSSPGALAYALGTDDACGVGRTLSIWDGEASLFDFAGSGAHASAMSQGHEYFDSFRITYWSVSADELDTLDWTRARQALEPVPPVWYE